MINNTTSAYVCHMTIKHLIAHTFIVDITRTEHYYFTMLPGEAVYVPQSNDAKSVEFELVEAAKQNIEGHNYLGAKALWNIYHQHYVI